MKQGMCVDLVVSAPALRGVDANGNATSEAGEVVEEKLHEVHDGAFADFTRTYLKHGGRVEGGGW